MCRCGATIDDGSFMFQLYGGGVFTGPCTANVNHSVTVVEHGEIVNNSWGKEWGKDGYVIMQRNVGDQSNLFGIPLLRPNEQPPHVSTVVEIEQLVNYLCAPTNRRSDYKMILHCIKHHDPL
jgi:hypothetical protein